VMCNSQGFLFTAQANSHRGSFNPAAGGTDCSPPWSANTLLLVAAAWKNSASGVGRCAHVASIDPERNDGRLRDVFAAACLWPRRTLLVLIKGVREQRLLFDGRAFRQIPRLMSQADDCTPW